MMDQLFVKKGAPVIDDAVDAFEGTRRRVTPAGRGGQPPRRTAAVLQPRRRRLSLLLAVTAAAMAMMFATDLASAYTSVSVPHHRISFGQRTHASLLTRSSIISRDDRVCESWPRRRTEAEPFRNHHRGRGGCSALSMSTGSNVNELFPLQKGSSVALVTPFHEDTGNIDMTSLDRLLDYHLDAGTNNLCILGTTGEASLLSMSERETVLRRVVDKVKGRMCILVGTGTINPNEIRAMTQQAVDVGCDAALVVTPYYVKPPQRGLVQHMVSCAGMGLPICMYNVPGRTGVNMLDESLALAAELHEGIVAVKDATGDLRRLQQLRDLTLNTRPDLLLYSGDDATSLDFVLQGGDGCISVTANVAASEMAIMMRLALQQQVEEARAIDTRLVGLHNNLFLESNPIPVKWAVQRLGLIESPYCRPPLATFDEATLGVQLEESLYQAGLLQ